MLSRKNIILIILVVIVFVSVCALGAVWHGKTKLQYVNLSEMLKNDHRLLGLVAVEDRSQFPNSLHFYRVNDAKEQVVTGTFSYIFTAPDEAVVFGSPNNDMTKQVLFVIDPIKIHLVNVKRLPGKMLAVRASHDARYLAIHGVDGKNKPYACIIPKNAGTTERCVYLDKKKTTDGLAIASSSHQGYWAGVKKSFYVIPRDGISPTNTFFNYDPSSQNLIVTSTGAEAAPPPTFVPYTISSRFGWYTVTSRTHSSSWVISLPTQWRILQLANGYLFALDEHKAYLINPKTKQAAFFINVPPVEQRVVSIP